MNRGQRDTRLDRRRALLGQFELLEQTLGEIVAEGMREAELYHGLSPDSLSAFPETPENKAMMEVSAGAFPGAVWFQPLTGEMKGALDRFFVNLVRMGYDAMYLRKRISKDVDLIFEHVDRFPEERLARAASYVKTFLRSAIGRDSF